MTWTCPHCGKRTEVTDDYLYGTGGMVVCPQCLGSEQLPGYGSRPRRQSPPAGAQRPATNASAPETSAYRSKRSPSSSSATSMPSVPPPHRTAAPAKQPPAAPATPPTPKKPAAKRKSKKRKPSGGASAWGCFWRSVLFTVALLAVYILFGWIMQLA